MKKIFQNKILLILTLCILSIFTLCTSCFAKAYDGDYSYSFDFNDKNYTVTGLTYDYNSFKYVVISGSSLSDSYINFNIIGSNSEIIFNNGLQTSSHSNDIYYSNCTTPTSIVDFSSDPIILPFWSNFDPQLTSGIGADTSTIKYANYDIKDSDGNVVFQVAPQVPEITKILVEQTTQAQIQEQMKKIITGFLKYLIVFVISVIAFWKGWKFLSKQFKTA